MMHLRFRAVTFFLLTLSLVSPRLAHAEGGVLYLTPDHAIYAIGDIFDVQVMADSGGGLMTSAEGQIAFNNAGIKVERISKDGSILGTWSTEPSFDNEKGTIQFAGWTKNNFSGNALLLTITFKALRDMPSNVRFTSGAILVGSDRSSNIIASLKPGVYSIAPRVVPPTPLSSAGGAASAASSPEEDTTSTDQSSASAQTAAAASAVEDREDDTASTPAATPAPTPKPSSDSSLLFLILLILLMIVLGVGAGYVWHHPRVRGRY